MHDHARRLRGALGGEYPQNSAGFISNRDTLVTLIVGCAATSQHNSGTGHGSYLTFPRAVAKIQGKPTDWDIVADSGNVKTRSFCPTCGSPVYITFSAMPFIAVHAASLDDPSRFKPQAVTYSVRGLAWDFIDPSLRRFEKMPS